MISTIEHNTQQPSYLLPRGHLSVLRPGRECPGLQGVGYSSGWCVAGRAFGPNLVDDISNCLSTPRCDAASPGAGVIKHNKKLSKSTTTTVLTHCPGPSRWVGTRRINHPGLCWSRYNGVAVASYEPYAGHLHFAPEDNHASTLSVRFLRADALPDTQPTAQSTEGQ